jgi:hypothetical protein
VNPAVKLRVLVLGVASCSRSMAQSEVMPPTPSAASTAAKEAATTGPTVAEHTVDAGNGAVSTAAASTINVAARSPSAPSKLLLEGSYWPFARLPADIGDIGQGSSTVFVGVPGGGCTHWNCGAVFSLKRGCTIAPDDTCIFAEVYWQTVFGNEDPLAGRAVQLHRGVVGHVHHGGYHLDGPSIAWPAATNGENEVTLRSGREEHLITLANALIDAKF